MVMKKKKKEEQISALILRDAGLQVGAQFDGWASSPWTRSHWLSYFVNAILNIMVTFGFVGCFLDSLGVAWHPAVLFAVIAGSAFIFAFSFMENWLQFFVQAVVLTFLAAGISQKFDEVSSGFNSILDSCIAVFNQNEFEGSQSSLTAFLVIAGVLMADFFNIIISRLKGYWVVILYTFPLLQLSMCGAGEAPAFYFGLYAAGIISLFCMRINGHFLVLSRGAKNYAPSIKKASLQYDYRVSGKTNFAVLVMVVFIVSMTATGVNIIYPKSSFHSGDGKTLADSLEDSMFSTSRDILTGQIDNRQAARGGISLGKMGTTGAVKQDNLPDLNVYIGQEDLARDIYLYVHRSSVYRDNTWLPSGSAGNQPGDWFVQLDHNGSNLLGTDLCKVFIEDVSSSGERYVPYWRRQQDLYDLETEGGGMFYYMPRKLTVPELKGIVRQVQENEDSAAWKDFRQWEELYREDAYAACLEVDAAQKERLLKLCGENGIQPGQDDVVEAVQKFLQENYEYSLMPGNTPSDRDFVDYFLCGLRRNPFLHP